MTLKEYWKNPQKTSSVYTNRDMYRNLYLNTMNKLILKAGGKFDTKIYDDGKHYIYHVKVISETVDDVYYDVVFEFEKGQNLSSTNFKAFTNAPSFIFVFAYAFNKEKMLIEDSKSRINKMVLSTMPVEKNPKIDIGYEKYICIASLYLIEKNWLNATYASNNSTPYTKDIYKGIATSDEKLAQRRESYNALMKRKSAEKKKKQSEDTDERIVHLGQNQGTNTRIHKVQTIPPRSYISSKKSKIMTVKKK